jgi:histidine ammonia-lyase
MLLEIGNSLLTPTNIVRFSALANDPHPAHSIILSEGSRQRIAAARDFIDRQVANGQKIYGINTGVGFMSHASVSPDQMIELQYNAIRSHCVGVGSPLPRDLVLGMWVVLLNSIAQGHRGLRLQVVDKIIQALQAGILAQVPSRGSVGASGDLTPSAHAALALLGEGRCTMPKDGRFIELSAADALAQHGLTPLQLGPKDGLSLINGTQLTTAMACKVWHAAKLMLHTANLAVALSVTGLRGHHTAFFEDLLSAHRHPGTIFCGREITRWLRPEIDPSAINHNRVQDPYSLRCAPQAHGAVWEDILDSERILQDEINASTDNPLVFADKELILHGGNFYAIYPARVLDRLASALTTLGSISERRINLAMNKEKSGLPYFLINNGGVCSGFMMIQTTAAALVSECKSLSFPASVDSIPTNCDQEDHVSMGPIAGFKALQIMENVRNILAIELLVAAQAIDLLKPKPLSKPLKQAHELIRAQSAFLEKDRVMAGDIRAVSDLIQTRQLLEVLERCDKP